MLFTSSWSTWRDEIDRPGLVSLSSATAQEPALRRPETPGEGRGAGGPEGGAQHPRPDRVQEYLMMELRDAGC